MASPSSPDEATCVKCGLHFLDGDFFSEHQTEGGRCREPASLGMIAMSYNPIVWGRPPQAHARRSPAQASFDRLIDRLPKTARNASLTRSDIERVRRALEKARR